MEKTTADMHDFLAAIVMNMADGIVVCKIGNGEIVYANPFLSALLGYANAELTGKHLGALGEYKVASAEPFTSAVSASIRNHGAWTGEVLSVRKDGTTFWCSVGASILELKPYGEVLLLVQKDISAQKAIEAALAESEQLRKRAQRLALIGHWRLNPHTTRLTGTDELYQIFELPKGAPLNEFDLTVHPDDRESTAKIMQKTLANTGRYDSTYRLITRNDNLKWVHAIGEGIYDEHGFLTEIAGSVQDITALRVAEDELQKMQKLQSLGVMAGGIAHDFNNINTLLFGSISLAMSKLDAGDPAYADLEIAEKALQRAANLSNQLLTFAKGGEPVKKNINLRKLIEATTRLDLTGSNIRLDFAAAPDLWKVHADAGQLEQVFTNLAINACQAMPDGGVLHIQLDNVSFDETNRKNIEPGNYVQVKVADAGEGIPDEIILQIFDPYFTTRKTGSGLGLATVYSIVKKHGGYIEVASKVGKGTTFVIFLPAAAFDDETLASEAAPLADDKNVKGRILVMDDEKDLCELIQRILQNRGYAVELAYDGGEAIARYRQSFEQGEAFDCIIMDLTVPGGTGGKDAMQAILGINPAALAIVSSGYAEDPVMANYRDYGFAGVIPKPYSPNTLLQVLQQVMAL